MPGVMRRVALPNGHTKRRTPDDAGGRWAISPAIPLFSPCHGPETKLMELLGSVELPGQSEKRHQTEPRVWRVCPVVLFAGAQPPEPLRPSRLIVPSSAESAEFQHTAGVRGRHRSLHGACEIMLEEGFGEGDLQRIGA